MQNFVSAFTDIFGSHGHNLSEIVQWTSAKGKVADRVFSDHAKQPIPGKQVLHLPTDSGATRRKVDTAYLQYAFTHFPFSFCEVAIQKIV